MGTDIFIQVEKQLPDGTWVETKEYGRVYESRSYALFSLLSRARGPNEPFKEPVGMPVDSPSYKWYTALTWEDANIGSTWYYVQELRDYLYDCDEYIVNELLEGIAGIPGNCRILMSFDY